MNRLWRVVRHDVRTSGWFWRLLLLVLVFDAGALVLANIVGPRWSVVSAFVVLVVWLLAMVHIHRWCKMERQITTNGWEEFLDGREELGEYEELGGEYEYETTDDEDD